MKDLQDIIKDVHRQALPLGLCDKFKGTENLGELIKVFTSPQGIEFTQRNEYPSLDVFRSFKPYGVEKYGIFIDAGDIEINNAGIIVLIGNTRATLFYNTNTEHQVIMLHGAKANITASQWAVVFVQKTQSCKLISTTLNQAEVL